MTEETTNRQYDHHRGSDPLLRPGGRWRAAGVLALSFAAFAVACAFFWQYMATGQWVDLSPDAYYTGLNTPLSRMFVYPLSVFAHPWLIVVISLMLALMFFVPVVTAVLYDEFLALGFVLIVAAIGRAPALALLQAVGCVLAARTHFRSDSPFVAVLLGLAPLLLYMVVFALTVGESASLPLKRWVLYAVVAVSLVVAVLAAAGVLGLVKVLGFRPGALCPVIAAMLVTGMIVYNVRVGADELDYALLVARLDRPGKPDALFESTSLEKWLESHPEGRRDREGVKARVIKDIETRKHDLIDRCEVFLSRHGDSDRASGVLWIEAQVWSLMLHDVAYEAGYASTGVDTGGQDVRDPASVVIACSAEYPHHNSRKAWQRLLDEHGGSPHAALAAWRLGQLALRRGDVAQADALLNLAQERLAPMSTHGQAAPKQDDSDRVFASLPSVPHGNADYYARAYQDVQRLLWLMRENQVLSNPASAEALTALVALNSNDPGYIEKLEALVGDYEGTLMHDNLKLSYALVADTKLAKATALFELAKDRPATADDDARIEANYVLGCLTMQTGSASALPLMPGVKTPREYFTIVANARWNPWRKDARDRLARLDALADQERP